MHFRQIGGIELWLFTVNDDFLAKNKLFVPKVGPILAAQGPKSIRFDLKIF